MANNTFLNYLIEFPNFLSLFIYSFFLSAISPILVDISKYLDTSPQDVNLVTTFFMIGTVIGIIATTFLNRRFKKVPVILAAYTTLIPVMVVLTLADSLLLFYLLYGISGLLLGITWIQANTNMLEGRVENKDSVVNLGHAFFAIGALASPFISSYLLKRSDDWRYIYYIVLSIIVVAIVLYIILIKKKSTRSITDLDAVSLKSVFSRRKAILLLLTVFMLIFYMISETIMFSWSPTFFGLDKMFTAYEAGFILSLFWIGMLGGRLLISVISYKIRSDVLLISLFIISISAIILSVFSKNRIFNFVGIGLTGLGFSGVVPLIISSGTSFFNKKKDIILVILFSLGLLGNSIGPYVARLSSNYDLRFSVLISAILVFISLMFILARTAYQKYHKKTITRQ